MFVKIPYSVRGFTPHHSVVSPGETLWFALRDLHIVRNGENYPNKSLFDLTTWCEPAGGLAHFFADVTLSHAIFKLMKAAHQAVKINELDGDAIYSINGRILFLDAIKHYLVESMGISFSDISILRIIPEIVYAAHKATRASISAETRRTVLQEVEQRQNTGKIDCYCCGVTLWSTVANRSKKGIALDHVWPRALGGVSTEANLLPICDDCNGAKSDRVSWATYGIVQDYTSAAQAPNAELLLKLSLHRRAASKFAQDQAITLKEAFIQLGCTDEINMINDVDGSTFFNLNAQNTAVLFKIW